MGGDRGECDVLLSLIVRFTLENRCLSIGNGGSGIAGSGRAGLVTTVWGGAPYIDARCRVGGG